MYIDPCPRSFRRHMACSRPQGMALPSGHPYEATHHSLAAVATSQYFANFFVGLARRSTHRFASAVEEDRQGRTWCTPAPCTFH